MRLCIFIFLMVSYSSGIQLRETEYECGAHGRFEYCIDGVPGCVIGCHCHPGYYFDTDTKICEPNIRLSQNFRRSYEAVEPTRVFMPVTPPVFDEPVTTSKNAVDEKIDIITKDADDLGDWLYNQFFKTIENQVINETKDDSTVSRRSDSVPSFMKKPTRRSHRYWRARRKKKKKKKKGLKSKLLRITEDDSLFDSDSSSTSDESSDSGSSSSTDDDASCDKSREKKIKSEHGHKKIVVFNKRPKPPLPSFIFLPNMETPFFPPIGLPPPPMPMYPMVPVPPMMGAFPFPAAPTPHACGTEANTTPGHETSTQPSDTKASTTKKTDDNPPTDKPPDETPSNDNPPDENPPADNPPADNPPDDNPPDDNPPTENTEPNLDTPSDAPPSLLRSRTKKRRGRNKLMQKLRDKLKRNNQKHNYLASGYQGPPISPPGFIASHLPNMRHKQIPEIDMDEELAALQDVDFKYLSQLIHRADLNKTNQNPPTTTPSIQLKNVLTLPPASRRSYYDSYPDQITQVLNTLANQPKNHISENHPAYNSPYQPTQNAPNQPTYNVPNQPTYTVPNQHTYNIPNRTTYNTPNQPIYNVPIQSTYNIPNQGSYGTYGLPNQLTYSAANQLNNNAPNHLNSKVPNQLAYNMANQPTYVSLNQHPQKVPYRKKIEDSNDVYYTNLGRQIASMIRNIDGDKEVDIEIKSSPNILNNNPVLTGQSGPRSYWERSVRSPYKQIMNSNKKEIENLKSSNENLFNLESKVETAAAIEKTLSLHELENIISQMHKTKSKFIRKNGSPHQKHVTRLSKSSFNVNLLPKSDNYFHSNRKINKRTQNILPNLSKPNNNNDTKNNNLFNSGNTKTQNQHSPLQLSEIGSSLLTNFMFTLEASDEALNETTPKTTTYQTNTNIPNIIPSRKPNLAAPQFVYKMPSPYFKSYSYTVLPLPPKLPRFTNMQATTSRTYYQQLSPMMLNHKSVTYYDLVNKNQYLYDKASIPLRPQSFPSSRLAPASRHDTFANRDEPSYFHHEVHHFDYFDDLL